MPGDNDTHLYGGSDQENRQTPTDQGFHGEAKAPLTDEGKPDQRRTAMAAGGNRIEVEELSGIAAAEAAGNVGTGQGS